MKKTFKIEHTNRLLQSTRKLVCVVKVTFKIDGEIVEIKELSVNHVFHKEIDFWINEKGYRPE